MRPEGSGTTNSHCRIDLNPRLATQQFQKNMQASIRVDMFNRSDELGQRATDDPDLIADVKIVDRV